MIVRRAEHADLAAMKSLNDAAEWTTHWSGAAWDDVFDASGLRVALIAEGEDGEVAGFLVASLAVETAEIETIAVSKQHRRQGIGALLVRELMTWCRQEGFSGIQLEVNAENVAAQGFYRALGFREQGRRPKYYASGEDAVLMGLDLAG